MAVWAVTALVALRPAAALYRAIVGDLGSSMAASSAATGVNWTWWQEFTARQPAFAETFQPYIIGFASVLANVSAFVSGGSPGPLFASTGAAYVLIWMFLLGGILDRYARRPPAGRARVLRGERRVLLPLSAPGGARRRSRGRSSSACFTVGCSTGSTGWVTREVTVERTAFALHAALTVLFVLVVAAVMMVFDYAKVRAVVEDRRSMIGALLAGARFVRRHPAAAGGVFLLNVLLFAAAVGAYALLARGARGGDGFTVLIGLIVAQAYIAGAAVREAVLLRVSRRPLPGSPRARRVHRDAPAVWPDSPAIETITEGPAGGHS